MKGTILLVFLTLVSCQIPSGDVSPFSYLIVDEVELVATPSQGAGTNNFVDVWAFVDGQTIGVYELPRRIPIANPEPGEMLNVSFQAGIRENGIQSNPRVYPFVGNSEFNVSLEEEEEMGLIPVFNYLDATVFRMVADFEVTNSFTFDEDGDSTSVLVISSEDAATGVGAGKLEVGAGKIMEQASTLVFNNIPVNGTPIYVEIEYKGNRDIDVGLIGIQGGEVFKDYFVSLRSMSEWNKAYINLTDLIIASNLTGYQLLLGIDNSSGSEDAIVFVDNIKLLHF